MGRDGVTRQRAAGWILNDSPSDSATEESYDRRHRLPVIAFRIQLSSIGARKWKSKMKRLKTGRAVERMVNSIQYSVIVEYMRSYSEDMGAINCTLAQGVPAALLETAKSGSASATAYGLSDTDRHLYWDALTSNNRTRVTELLGSTNFNKVRSKDGDFGVRATAGIESRDASRRVSVPAFRTMQFERGIDVKSHNTKRDSAVLVCRATDTSGSGGEADRDGDGQSR